jgi:RNA polymerase sigma-70 factor (ECF subfamily)
MRDRKRFDPSETSIAALDPSPSSVLAVKGQHKLLLAALRRLPIDIQIMLELHYWEGMAVKDIAQVLDMNPNTVKTHMKRGRAKLNEEMTALADSKEQLETTLRGLSRWAAQLRAELGEESES